MKEFRVQIPEGMEIDKENSTFECIRFKRKKEPSTYEEILKESAKIKGHTYYSDCEGNVYEHEYEEREPLLNHLSLAKEHRERLLAITKLMNVAYYYNEIVDRDVPCKYKIVPTMLLDTLIFQMHTPNYNDGIVYFKTRESFYKAKKVLGEETFKLALSL